MARLQRDLFYTTCYVTLGIFAAVGLSLGYVMLRYRSRGGAAESAGRIHQGHGNPWVEGGLILASLVALGFIAVPTLKAIWYTYDVPWDERDRAYVINATGYQWWWKFEYPSEQLNPPGGGAAPLSVANELVIPAGRPVRVNLRTADVIHSFWVPKLAGKVDMMPNRANHLWLQADHPGYYYGQCAQYCGDSHAVMRFRVIALEEGEFASWLTAQKREAHSLVAQAGVAESGEASRFSSFQPNQYGFGEKWTGAGSVAGLELWRGQQLVQNPASADLIAKGRQLFQQKSCIACHTVRGQEGAGILGPDLTHLASRTTIAGGLLENGPDQMARWIRHPDQVKPGNKMYTTGYVPLKITLDETEVAALVAYLGSLK